MMVTLSARAPQATGSGSRVKRAGGWINYMAGTAKHSAIRWSRAVALGDVQLVARRMGTCLLLSTAHRNNANADLDTIPVSKGSVRIAHCVLAHSQRPNLDKDPPILFDKPMQRQFPSQT